ncbi:hypothetical protein F5887DRAFT_453795 [Amanita rubescens]|nr:hypothetical protein F5887DRAFT_453795 [Amanita rubescens]
MSLLLQENGPSLASVVGSPPTEWEPFKASSKSRPAQFHAMFWGKSMANEEPKWRDAQPPSMPVEGTELGNAERQGGDEHMDMDVSEEDDDDDDDIIEGCYSLEIGIKGFEFPRIWIRAEYIRIYNALEDRYRMPSYPYLAPAVVITGQPGIGET